MLIAITASVYEITSANHLWCNGITQNSMYLALLMKKLNHDIKLIHTNPEKLKNSHGFPEDIDVINIDDIFDLKFDIIISLGFVLNENTYINYKIKYPNFKHILYVCGNTFISTMETMLNKPDELKISYPRYPYDEIWVVPQNEKTDSAYLKYYYNNKNVTVVPFVWDPILGEKFMESTERKEYSHKDINSFGVVEPNLSVVKTSLFPIMIAEEYLRQKNDIKDLYLMCSEHLKTNKTLLDFLKDTILLRKKKLSVESRYPILTTLSSWVDLVISFQMENPLNYAYFDITWWGWPLVHNAYLCKDIGYYYDGFDINQAVTTLDFAVKNHPHDLTYKERMRGILKRYTINNNKLLSDYEMLLNNVMSNNFKKYTYDWKNNSIY